MRVFSGFILLFALCATGLQAQKAPCSAARVHLPDSLIGADSLTVEVQNIQELRLVFFNESGYPIYNYQESVLYLPAHRDEQGNEKKNLKIPLSSLKLKPGQEGYFMYSTAWTCFDRQVKRKTGGLYWNPNKPSQVETSAVKPEEEEEDDRD